MPKITIEIHKHTLDRYNKQIERLPILSIPKEMENHDDFFLNLILDELEKYQIKDTLESDYKRK